MTDARRRKVLTMLAGSAAGAAFAQVAPQDFPSKPIRVLIPASAGTTGDILARILSGPMGRSLGHPVVVEPMPGAGGITATDRLVRSPKDGYTLAMASNNHVINPSVYKSMPFDSIRDISTISIVGSTPVAIVAHPSLPATTTQELIALAKAKPDQLNYGSGGNGSVLHLAGVLFTSQAGVDIRHVPYKGFAPMLTDVLSGHIQLGIGGVASVAEYVRAGRLRAIAVTTRTRSSILPDVPTFAESGLPNYSFEGWLALIGPAGLPKPVVDRLHSAVTEALAQKEVQDAFATHGVTIIGSTPDAAARFFRTELDKHAALIKRSGAVLE